MRPRLTRRVPLLLAGALVAGTGGGCDLGLGGSTLCSSDGDCPPNFHCAAQQCVRGDGDGGSAADRELPDAAQDATRPDAGLADLARADIGWPDVDQLDTDLPDANLPDTDMPDTNLPDTNLPDTNLPDTNLPDTVPPALDVVNPSFEADPSLPTGWTAYGEQCSVQIYRPPAFGIDPPVPDGLQIYGCAVNWPPHLGGIWQQVGGVVPGIYYSARAFSYQQTTCPDMWAHARFGLDPTGGIDPGGPNIIWTPLATNLGGWSAHLISFTGGSPAVTLFLEYQQGGDGNNCDYDFTINYFDLVTVTPQ